MAELKHGNVTVVVSDQIAPPQKAGNLSPEEVRRIVRAPKGLGLVSDEAAHSLTRAGARFLRPAHLTEEALREKGARSEEVHQAIREVRRCLQVLLQASLLFDAEAYDQLRELNDLVKAQVRRNPALAEIFEPLLSFFAKGTRKGEDLETFAGELAAGTD